MNFPEAEQLYLEAGMKEFNSIITQVFNKLYQTDEPLFIGAPAGSGQQICAELAIFREIQSETAGKIVYIGPVETLCKLRYQTWKERLGNYLELNVVLLTGNL